MKTHCQILIMIITLLFGGRSTLAKDPDGRYVWPLEGQTNISSGFCDYRQQHYHGGIDISTDGREGFSVRAADSGHVMRISTSYWGYGKGLYIKMADGQIAVYGHLSDFSEKINEYVEKNQYAAKRYQQNLWPGPDEIPITRGEIVAKTGQTGAGPPHLHFEIRTGDNRPLNPLRFGFDAPDRISPSIKSVTLEPRQPDRLNVLPSQVDGGLTAKTFNLSGPSSKRTFSGTPSIAGKVGIVVETSDAISASRWSVSSYVCRLIVNGVLVTSIRQDSINYDDTRLINLHRSYNGRPGIAERPINLFRLPGNRLWHYGTLLNDGWLELDKTVMPGINDVRIEVEDAAGNTSMAEFQIVAQELIETGEQTDVPVASDGNGQAIEIEPKTWNRNGLFIALKNGIESRATYFADRQMTQPLVALKVKSETPVMWIPAEAPVHDTVWIESEGKAIPKPLGLHAVSSTSGGSVVSDDGRARVRFSSGHLYEAAFFALQQESLPATARSTVTPAYRLIPGDIPFARTARLSIDLENPKDANRLAIYGYRPDRNSWSYEGAERDDGARTIACDIGAPGIFAVLADTKPPVIREVRPGRGEQTKNSRPWIRFEMFDDLAGIGSDADVLMTIDGAWTLVEYDPDTRQAKARPREALTPGEHRVEISVKDRAGNEQSFLRIVHIVQ